jgi:hypothetical protein
MLTLHQTTFEYLKPNAVQTETMERLRQAAKNYAAEIDAHVPLGPDKTFILRQLREVAMWVNVAIIRNADGSPRK